MAHLIESMAYVGQAPWHHLGHHLPPKQSIEQWAQKAGMDWEITESPVRYATDPVDVANSLRSFDEQKVLFRSDTKRPLSVVSGRYQVVQPRAVLEFYRDLTEVSGYELETAGVLKEGRKFWALAKIGKEAKLGGGDVIKGYLLLATSCDGTLATTATPTTIRVVCNNTLTMALDRATGAVKVPHSTAFDPDAVKKRLGLAVSHWDEFMYRMKALSKRKVKDEEAARFFLKVLCGTEAAPDPTQRLANDRALKRVQELYAGHGHGAELQSAKQTAWGLLNAVTEYVDHERRARSQDFRLDSAWFGQGAAVKERALGQALQLAG
jgi:phage/plasmid-like protein (TIGR03299 family)